MCALRLSALAATSPAAVYPACRWWDILTETKKDTVNAALRAVAALAARRRDLQRLVSGGLPDLEDAEVMRAAWQR
jgi:hypothetical protein